MTQPIRTSNPAPPEGYGSWLEYAVASFDSRQAVLHTLFDDKDGPSRHEVEAAVWAEFNDLRQRAGMAPVTPKNH